jgi:hypothetical protein
MGAKRQTNLMREDFMMKRNCLKLMAAVLTLVSSANVFAYGTGYSAYPLGQKMKLVTAEVTGIFTEGSGAGLQGRYTHKLTPRMILDAGAGLGGGERSSRIFAGADFEIFPDYMKQPRVSLKTTITRADEFDITRNQFGVSPTVSKGFSFWGNEAYPFVAVPVALSLDNKSNTYQTVIAASTGITGPIPIEGYRDLSGNVELNVDLKNSFTALFFGVSYPLK